MSYNPAHIRRGRRAAGSETVSRRRPALDFPVISKTTKVRTPRRPPARQGENMLRRTPLAIACLLLLYACLAVGASAQGNNASLTGLITDTTGAVVPNASVTIKNKATNVETTATTDGSGYYTFASVPVGTYTLTAERQGFKRVVLEDVKLEVGQKARVDTVLEVGAVNESITVTAATLLATQEATTGGVIDNRLVAQLPLSGRNWDDLISLVPGVQADRYTEEGGSTAAGRTGGVNVHGVRSLQNNFVLDGVDNNSISENVQELTTQVARPSTPPSTSSTAPASATPTSSSTTAPGRASPRTSRTSSAATSAAPSSRTRPSSSSTTRARASVKVRRGSATCRSRTRFAATSLLLRPSPTASPAGPTPSCSTASAT